MTPSTSLEGQDDGVGARADGTGLSSSIEPASGLDASRFDPSRVSDVLDAAADLLSKPGAWTKGEYARRADGSVTAVCSPNAVCWCAFGALLKCAGGFWQPVVDEAADYLADHFGGPVSLWNDAFGQTAADVVQGLRVVATLARSEGK